MFVVAVGRVGIGRMVLGMFVDVVELFVVEFVEPVVGVLRVHVFALSPYSEGNQFLLAGSYRFLAIL